MKLGRWALLGVTAIAVSAACGGRNDLPAGGGYEGDFGGSNSVGGDLLAGGSTSVAGVTATGGKTFGGSSPVGGSIGTGGKVSTGGSGPIAGAAGAGVCEPGTGFCKGTTIARCDADGSGYATMACPRGQTCQQNGDIVRCVKQVCTPGQVQCDATGTTVVVCAGDGASLISKQDCSAQGQVCRAGVCRNPVCQPNQRFCSNGDVRICNADGTASTVWQNCGANQYCDPKLLACQNGVCTPNQPACNGTLATTCNDIGSGYLPGGVNCAAAGLECVNGSCQCPAGSLDCDGSPQDGCETNISTDPDNCGGCNLVCSASHIVKRTCDDVCDGTCQTGFDDCNGDKQVDGCETNVNRDAKNCGGCGVVCSNNHVAASCVAGNCNGKCAANFNDCNGDKQSDGCESNSQTDAKNCGGCGIKCSASHVKAVCTAGACSGDCANGFDDCNGNKQTDGCETNTNTDENNCGACGKVCAAGETCTGGTCSSMLTFTGIKQNLAIADLAGWTQCYSEAYGTSTSVLSTVQTQCKGSYLMLACRAKGSSILQLAAYAPQADVLFDTGNSTSAPMTHNNPHNANGVGWYFNSNESWGFAPQGDAIQRFTCDTQDSSIGNGGVDGDQRLCWHTNTGRIDGGWRCGKNDQLNSSFDYERLLFTAP
jgi:hypothetical protein